MVMGRHVATMAIKDRSGNRGLAVNEIGTLMAVSNWKTDTVSMYGLPCGKVITSFGGWGSGPGQFRNPEGLCFTVDGGGLLVADEWNNRVQEFCVTGDTGVHKRTIGQGVLKGNPRGVAANADVIVVSQSGVFDNGVVVFDFVSGDFLRSFGPHGSEPGHLCTPRDLCLTPDGTHVWIADSCCNRVAMLSVSDGHVVTELGGGLVCPTGVCLAGPQGVVVANQNKSEVAVLSPDGAEIRASIGSFGIGDGQFCEPRVVVHAAGHLFVLDEESPRVLVFQ